MVTSADCQHSTERWYLYLASQYHISNRTSHDVELHRAPHLFQISRSLFTLGLRFSPQRADHSLYSHFLPKFLLARPGSWQVQYRVVEILLDHLDFRSAVSDESQRKWELFVFDTRRCQFITTSHPSLLRIELPITPSKFFDQTPSETQKPNACSCFQNP
ncbi:hypothetical protein BDR04DRAFT_182378 [Suillus decipiens]|nr:hypothetical protein BDR04DRAFT_182378 [Suillus decipiens]